MIGKIKNFNSRSLLIFNTFGILITSYIFNNFIFIGIFLASFLISSNLTKKGIFLLNKLNLLQNIRIEGPSNHFKKINTPTVGGIFIIIPFLIFLLTICIKYYSIKIFLLFCCIFGFFIIGFLDDYLSIKNKKNTGLKSLEKLFLQSLISSVFILLAFKADYITPSIVISESLKINTSLMILPISFFTLVGLSNSVNLTDGLDGLASGCSGVVFFGLGTEILLQ